MCQYKRNGIALYNSSLIYNFLCYDVKKVKIFFRLGLEKNKIMVYSIMV